MPIVLGNAWLRTLAVRLALYGVVTAATVATQNVHLVPSVILLGPRVKLAGSS